MSQDASEDLGGGVSWVVVQGGRGSIDTHHDDGDGQQDPVEQSRIPVDGLYDGLGHDGRHGSGDAVLMLSSAWTTSRCHFLKRERLPTRVWSSGHASSSTLSSTNNFLVKQHHNHGRRIQNIAL